MKQKAFFIVFEGLSFGEKIKIADTSFIKNSGVSIVDFEQANDSWGSRVKGEAKLPILIKRK